MKQPLFDLGNMGAHGNVILKSDQENPISDVPSEVCKLKANV